MCPDIQDDNMMGGISVVAGNTTFTVASNSMLLQEKLMISIDFNSYLLLYTI